MVEVKVLMALAEENDVVSKEGARNGEWVNISMRKVHTLLEMEDNDDRKTYLDYLCIDLNYVEEQRNNLLSKYRDLVHELNACKEQLLILTQAKLDFLIMQHVNTEILKENKNLRIELKEITSITKTWLNSFILPNHDTGRILPAELQRNTTDPSFVVTDSLVTDYDSADESSVCSTPLPPLKKLDGAEPIFGPKTIKSILKLKSTFKAETLKGVIINESSSAPAKDNKSSSASKLTQLLLLDMTQNGLTGLSLEREINLRNPQHAFKRCKACGSLTYTTTDHNDIEWFKKGEALQAKKKPIWYLDSGCSRHMTSVKSYLHKYVEQPGPKVVFRDHSTCTTKGYGSIKCNGIVFTKVAFVNSLKYNLIRISQLCDAKYIVQFDEKRGTIFNSKKEVVMISLRIKQSKKGISINQEKYVKDLLKKYDINGSSVKTPMVPPNNLGPDLSGKAVNKTRYRSMIRSLMYLTTSRLGIYFIVSYARYQANPKESHLIAVKRIFRKTPPVLIQLQRGKLGVLLSKSSNL
ncbi:hypothetical protein Tco_0592592 [Tanacetum coccineum]